MADAIISVPIYNQNYKTISDLCINAKYVSQISISVGSSGNGSVTVDPFNIALLVNGVCNRQSYPLYQVFPYEIIQPNSSFKVLFTQLNSSGYNIASISTTENSIIVYEMPSPIYYFTFIIID